MVQGRSPQGEHVASISSLFGSREGREDLIHSQISFSLPNAISHNVYYVKKLAAAVRYHVGLSAFLIVVIFTLNPASH